MKNKSQRIMGRNAIYEVAKHLPRRIKKVFISSALQNKSDELLNLLKNEKISISFVDKRKLSQMVESESHQSFVAEVHPRNFLPLEDFLESNFSRLLVLDSIVDPQNMGTLMRLAECFSFDGIMYSKNRGCDITPVVAKASCGAVELLPLIRVSNLVESLKKLKEADFDVVIADVNKKAIDINKAKFAKKVALVMGSEAKGVRPLVGKQASMLVHIPLLGKITSLNVSQAAAILCFHLQRANIGPS